jgi:hypothetical protein
MSWWNQPRHSPVPHPVDLAPEQHFRLDVQRFLFASREPVAAREHEVQVPLSASNATSTPIS